MVENSTKSDNHPDDNITSSQEGRNHIVSWLDTVMEIVKTDNVFNQEHKDDNITSSPEVRNHTVSWIDTVMEIIKNDNVVNQEHKDDNITSSPEGRNHTVSWLDTVMEIVRTDNVVNQEHKDDIWMHLVFSATVLFVILVNSYVLYWLKKKNGTLVDSMIWHDCIANIGGMLGMLLVYPRHVMGLNIRISE